MRPDAVELDDERHPRHDPRYKYLPPELLPATECLKMSSSGCCRIGMTVWCPTWAEGRQPIVVAHGNSLRALVKHLDGLSNEEVVGLNIPTGVPLLYELDDSFSPVSSRYLGDPEAAKAAAEAVARQAG